MSGSTARFTKMLIRPVYRKKQLQLFLGTINVLSKFSPVTAGVCEQPRKLTSVKSEQLWNRTYQDLYDKAKRLITKDAYMKFYDTSKPLYIEIDASGVSPWHYFIAGMRGYELWEWGSAEQCSSPPNCVCKKKSVQHRVAENWHWEGSARCATQIHEVPALLFCKGSMCHHWPQANGSHDQ